MIIIIMGHDVKAGGCLTRSVEREEERKGY
jgi:hypothetical protein